ncbi:class I SAM-dependent DNA methyltransferase [Nocardia higoensis]|uniref:class I SAM-dependent DNA methyltransferase n=1 Tax=Nocardia higoensis TaxID=228599 RepID=UPI0002E0F6C7|nr:class I SAM-dependent methyltransferase [Nocardia higoensis]
MTTDAAQHVIGLYERHADAWARERGDRLVVEKGWLDRFTALLPDTAAVIDLGCGTGMPIAGHLVAQGFRVTGIDSSPAMIDMARARFPGHEWQVGDMRTSPPRRRFDGILAWDSFFHLCPADQRRMFPIFGRLAAPGAALMFTSGPTADVRIGSFAGEPLYHASLDSEEYRTLLRDNGFEVLAYRAEDPDCGLHTIWLARRT